MEELPSTKRLQSHIKKQLFQSLREERQLNNRLAALFTQKQRIFRRIENAHMQVQNQRKNRINVQKQSLKTFKHIVATQYQKQQSSLFSPKHQTLMSRQISWIKSYKDESKEKSNENCAVTRISNKKHRPSEELLKINAQKQQEYLKAKQLRQANEIKIKKNKTIQLQRKQKNHKLVGLMLKNSKQNIKKYWVQRGEYIKQQKQLDVSMHEYIYANSLHNRSILQKQQEILVKDLNRVAELQKQLKKTSYKPKRLCTLPNQLFSPQLEQPVHFESQIQICECPSQL